MKKLVTIFLFCICTNSLYLFTLDLKYTLSNSLVTSDDLQAVNTLMDLEVVENVYIQADSVTLELSSTWVEEFERQRTKELQLMHEELKKLQEMLSLRCLTNDGRANIERTIQTYSFWIDKREQERNLSTSEFFQQYTGRWQNLADDVAATKNRLSGISY